MSGVSLGESHGRPRTGKKTSRRCNDGTGADHVVLIDVECETFGNVIFIDVPESTPKKFRGDIIFIDDDDDESNDNCITTQRERIKETSEYKKALEEELASRQKALAIQVYFVLLNFGFLLCFRCSLDCNLLII